MTRKRRSSVIEARKAIGVNLHIYTNEAEIYMSFLMVTNVVRNYDKGKSVTLIDLKL